MRAGAGWAAGGSRADDATAAPVGARRDDATGPAGLVSVLDVKAEAPLSVVTITMSPSVDYAMSVEELIPEEKLRADLEQTDPGGGGIQVARALRRFGTIVEAIMTVGGPTGRALLSLLEREGLNVHPVWVQSDTRPSITLRVRSAGQLYRIISAQKPLEEYEYTPVLSRLRELPQLAPYVVLSGSFPPGVPPDLVHEVAGLVAERGSRLVVDTSGAALEAAVAAKVAVLKPSKSELAALVGVDADDPAFDVPTAARDVVGRGVGAIVVSLASEGAYVVAEDGQEAMITAPPVEVISTVGAGDSTVAGLVAGLSRGVPLIGAARLGVACGSGTCRHPGSDLFTLEDLTELLPHVVVDRRERPAPA
jgi:6-phosphofructokinase 2